MIRNNLRKEDNDELAKKKERFWNQVALDHSVGKVPNQSEKFFHTIPLTIKSGFFSSTNRIVQLGVASGKFLAESGISKKRKCIGYDTSNEAVEKSKVNAIDAKLVNLNSVNENLKLNYIHQLETDLSEPTDILAIRIFEYLDPQAVILLIFALIDKAKPNSIFYIETYLGKETDFGHKVEHGYIASFFGPRTDMKFCHHSINFEDTEAKNVLETNNQLIVQKL